MLIKLFEYNIISIFHSNIKFIIISTLTIKIIFIIRFYSNLKYFKKSINRTINTKINPVVKNNNTKVND